jgi:hypothetical protein
VPPAASPALPDERVGRSARLSRAGGIVWCPVNTGEPGNPSRSSAGRAFPKKTGGVPLGPDGSRAASWSLLESMRTLDDMLIPVQREWNGWRTAAVRLGDLQNVHWLQPSGAPVPLVHAYVVCASFVNGDVPHDCGLTPPPHRLLVCVLKKHIAPSAYLELSRRAAERLPIARADTRHIPPARPGAPAWRERRTAGS